jgi:integrase
MKRFTPRPRARFTPQRGRQIALAIEFLLTTRPNERRATCDTDQVEIAVSRHVSSSTVITRRQTRTVGRYSRAESRASGRIEQSRAFLAVAHRDRFGALFSVALASGLRLGEATGLRWDDVNIETGEVRVRQQLQRVGKQLLLQPLKTEKSRRTLMLPLCASSSCENTVSCNYKSA